MPRKSEEVRRGRKRSAPTPILPALSTLFGDGRRVQPYKGKQDKLILSIDIGTTFSAVSYCVLKPRCVPNLETVSSWPGQANPDQKVPSVLYYDQSGMPRAWGAETLDPDMKDCASEHGWTRVEWFKLALRPPHLPLYVPQQSTVMRGSTHTQTIPSLPAFLTPHQVHTDFLKFMLNHIKSYFCKHAGSEGSQLWTRLFPTMEVVFAIPSGWEVKQQFDICAAAVQAGFMGDVTSNGSGGVNGLIDKVRERIQFVAESEAAMVYAAESGYVDKWLEAGKDVILCDAGGGTIDVSVYTVVKASPLELKEKFASKCVIAGAVLVNQYAGEYICKQIRNTPWNNEPQIIDQLIDDFENDTKKRFKSPDYEYGIGKGGTFERYPEANIRSGRLYIPGKDMATFFEPTLSAIKAEIHDIFINSGMKAKNVVMVGGFMNSSYAYTELEAWGTTKGLKFTKPDGVLAKAVSHGGLLWYLTKPVKGYILKVHYGMEASLMVCDVPDEELIGKSIIPASDGSAIVEGGWSNIAYKGEELNPGQEIAANFERYVDWGEDAEAYKFEEKLYLCRADTPPTFLMTSLGNKGYHDPNVEHVCTIVVNLKSLFEALPWEVNKKTGKKFKRLEFIVSIRHNGCSLDAYAYWTIKGLTVSSDAKLVLPHLN